MSGTRKHDWPGLTREYVLMKSREPLLTQNEFFRRHGIKTAWGNRKIGKQMELAWGESQKKALAKVVERTGIDLADEMEKQFRAAKAGFALGARNILPRLSEDGTEISAPHQPGTFTESLMLMKTCGDSIRDITKMFTGGERLIPPKGKDDEPEARRTIQIREILKNPKARELADKLREELESSVTEMERTE
jgi:hypothetical protein